MTSPVIVLESLPSRTLFDQFDLVFNTDYAVHDGDNSRGKLAWMESYLLQSYIRMYRATGDKTYLRKLCTHFESVLRQRDDKLQRIDDYTSTPLPGWGSGSYNLGGAKWHVFIVHTGMIILGPAEFVNIVTRTPELHPEFQPTASLFRTAIEECIAGAEPYWRDGPGPDEGYYSDPAMGLLPLNQSNAMGCVLLEMHDVTGNDIYLDHATRLAQFFRRRMALKANHYEWAYWAGKPGNETTSATEDISHAAINIDFAVRCARRGIVFNSRDIELLAATWLHSVKQADGSWSGTIGGTGSSEKYMPGSAGRWLVLCEILNDTLAQKLYKDVRNAYEGKPIKMPSEALGIANLELYNPMHRKNSN